MDEELKRVIEAILFAAARSLELPEIAKLCRRTEEEALTSLLELKKTLDETNGPTILMQDGTAWKLTVREKYVQIIKRVVSKTELPNGHLETLAVVAYKAPVLQSNVVRIRTNKAYEHLSYLESKGFVTREKKGRTKLIRLSPKFFEYFNVASEKLKQKFSSAGDAEKAIEAKEKEATDIEEEQRKETKRRLEKPKIRLEEAELETYTAQERGFDSEVQVFMEKLGELEVYDAEEKKTEKTEEEKKTAAVQEKKPESKGMYPEGIPKDMEAKIEEKIRKLLSGEEAKEAERDEKQA